MTLLEKFPLWHHRTEIELKKKSEREGLVQVEVLLCDHLKLLFETFSVFNIIHPSFLLYERK